MDIELADIHVEALIWSGEVIEKLLRLDRIDVAEAESILDNNPVFIVNGPRPTRVATYGIFGRSDLGHSIAIYVSETGTPGVWQVHTALRSRIAHRILQREGRI